MESKINSFCLNFKDNKVDLFFQDSNKNNSIIEEFITKINSSVKSQSINDELRIKLLFGNEKCIISPQKNEGKGDEKREAKGEYKEDVIRESKREEKGESKEEIKRESKGEDKGETKGVKEGENKGEEKGERESKIKGEEKISSEIGYNNEFTLEKINYNNNKICESLTIENEKIKETLKNSEKEYNNLKETTKNKEKEYENKEKEYNILKEDIKNKEKEYENKKKEYNILKEDIKNKEKEYKTIIENKENEYNNIIEDLKNKENEYKTIIENKENEYNNLKKDLKNKENEYKTIIENKENEYNNIIEDLKNKENEYKTIIENKENEYNNIIEDLKNKENEYKTIIEKKENEYNIELNNKTNEFKNIEKNIYNELNKIKKENNIINNEIVQLKKEINEKKYKNEELKKDLEIQKNKNKVADSLIIEKDIEINNFLKKFKLIEEIMKSKGEVTKENYNSNPLIKEEEMKVNYDNDKYNIIYGKVGIKNEGNNCYMSSVIQILKNLTKFSFKIIDIKKDDNIVESLQNLFSKLYYSEEKYISLYEFKKNFGKIYKRFETNDNNDSTYFLIYLLQYLHKIFNKLNQDITNIHKFTDLGLKKKELYELTNFLNKYEAKNNSFIHDLFYGYQMNEIICSGCHNFTISFQSFNILDLPLLDEKYKYRSLEQCLNCYLITKDLKDKPGFDCDKCKRKLLSHKTSIIKLPYFLIINLKRVGENTVYYHEIEIPYTFKTKSIDKLNKFNNKYELKGFIKHYGNEKNGHNIAYSKNIFDNKWYSYNDKIVREENEHPSIEKSFLLFYELIDNIEE